MLICLPLEGMAAVAMPNCQMHDPHQMTVNADMDNMDDMAPVSYTHLVRQLNQALAI